MNQPDDLSMVVKGKLTLADALKELETVKKAFEISARIEERLEIQDQILQDIQIKAESLVSYSYVNTRLEDTKSQLVKIIKDKFEELSASYFSQLNEKLNRSEIEGHISTRCTWMAFNALSQNVGSLKSRIDKHIFSDFEGLKTKMKVQFGDKYTELMNVTSTVKEEFNSIKLRLTVVEQKLQEMFVDDGLGDSEDYDSQEENDNINQNLGAKDSLEDEDEEVTNQPVKVDNEKPTIKIDEAKAEEPTEKKVSTDNQPVEIPKITEHINPVQPALPSNPEKPAEIKSQPLPIPETPQKTEAKPVHQIDPSKPTEEKPIEPLKPSQVIEKIEKVEEKKAYTIEMTKAPDEPATKDSENPVPEVKKPEQDKSSASRAAGLEIPDRQHRRRDEDATSSRHRRGGSSAGDALSRKNSMSSSVAAGNMGGVGGMRGIQKKITSLQKDLETFKAGIDETKGMFTDVHAEIGKIYDKIGNIRSRCEEIEDSRQKMEMSFIKALRRSGKDKKTPAKATVETLSSKDLKKIYLELNQKSSKIGSIETILEKVSLDMKFVKSQFQTKLNEIILAVHSFESYRKDSTKESFLLETKMKSLEDQFQNLSFSVNSEVENIKGPMNDLISDQQREKEILEENLKRQRQGFKEMLEDCSLSVKNFNNESVIQSRITTTRPRTRKSIESPKVSLKHKFFEGNNSFRQSNPSLIAEENWLSGFPDGKTLALPKVGVKKSKVSLSVDDPRKSL